MLRNSPRKWTDEDVLAYLQASNIPLEHCRVNNSLYGYVDDSGQVMVCMDDDDERVARVVKYLIKVGAPTFPS